VAILRADIFKKDANFAAFEQILYEARRAGDSRRGTLRMAVDVESLSSGIGCKNRSAIPNCCHRGRCPGFLAGPVASTRASRNRSWTRLSEASHWATKPGWNQSHDGSTLNPPCVPEADHKFVFQRSQRMWQTKQCPASGL